MTVSDEKMPDDDAAYLARTKDRLRALASTSSVNLDADADEVRERLRNNRRKGSALLGRVRDQ